MEALLDNSGNDTTSDDTPTRHSSKLSLGSSPSVLSGDEEDGDDEGLKNDPSGNDTGNNHDRDEHHSTATLQGMEDGKDDYSDQDALTSTNMAMDENDKARTDEQGDNDNGRDDMDDLFDGSLPASTSDDLDDINLEHDSASPLSSVPDDFPLSPETQDDSLLLSPPTHNSIPSDSQSSIPPPTPSPMTRRQKQLQAETTAPQESGSGKKRTKLQGDTTTTLSSNSEPRKRKRRARNKGGQYQSSNQNNLSSASNDKNKDENDANDQGVSQQAIKSRRVSIHGRTIYTKSALNTKIDTHVEEDDDDEDEEDNKMDETTNSSIKQIPLAPTKHHNSTTGTPAPLPKTKSTTQQQQQHGSKDSDSAQQDTDENNNEEKENTPVISNQDNGGTPIRNDFSGISNTTHTNPLEDSEKLPTNGEERDDQQQHKEAFDALTHIEVEFARLREKLYQEKMTELNEEAVMIANGTHPNLVTLMTEIEEKKGRRISTAEAWRKHQHDNFKRQFEGFEYQANVHFISRKSSMRRKILAEVNGKRWRLEDEQGKLNDPSHKHGNLIPGTNTLTIRKQGKREETMDLQDIKDAIGFAKAPQVAGLSSQDIRDDLLLLGLGASGSH